MCKSINDFGSVEVRLNDIKTKHSLTKLSQVSGGYVWSKFDQNFAVLEFCYTFLGVGGRGKWRTSWGWAGPSSAKAGAESYLACSCWDWIFWIMSWLIGMGDDVKNWSLKKVFKKRIPQNWSV